MSKGVKKVLGIVAAIAIPFAAPAIAGAIGLSSAIGGFMASTVVGAGLGAANAALTGGNVGLGLLTGGIGGAIGGWQAGQAAASAAGSTQLGTAAAGTATTSVAPGAIAGATDSAVGLYGVQAAATGGATVATSAPTLASAVANLPGTIVSALGGPTVAMDMAVKIGTALVAGQSTDDLYAGMAPEQQAAFKQMEADLKVKYEQDRDTFNQQLRAATAMINSGTQMDPNQIARDEANRAKIRNEAASRAGLRAIPASMGGALAARQRADAIEGSKVVGLSYAQGYTQGQQRKNNYIETGYRMLPTAPTPPSEKMYDRYAGLGRDAQDRAGAVGDTIGDIYDTWRTGGSYYSDIAARQRRKRTGANQDPTDPKTADYKI